MKNKSALLFLLFFSFNLIAQSKDVIIHKKEISRYEVNGEYYKFKKLEPFFDRYPEIKKDHWKQYLTNKRIAQVSLVGAGISWTLALSLDAGGIDCDSAPWVCNEKIFASGLFALVFTFALLPASVKHVKAKAKLVDLYNEQINQETGYKKPATNTRLGMVKNGIGLVVEFQLLNSFFSKKYFTIVSHSFSKP